jgi:hypothetical protein
MRILIAVLAAAAALGFTACSTVTNSAPPAPSSPSSSPTAGPTGGNTPQGAPSTNPPAPPVTVPNVTSPWAVVSAYYGDIESGNYAEAFALIGNGATTGQAYQQFVSGFACTGSQQVSEDGTSGDQVTFSLTATDSCTGQVHTYMGTDTVQNGTIVAANVQQTS